MKKRILKQPQPGKIVAALAISAACLSVCKGATVFSETFSGTTGTAINGTTADIGGAWYDGNGAGGNISAENSLDTSGAGRLLFDSFTSSLGAGQMLTLSYDMVSPTPNDEVGGPYNGCWAGVSLYTGYIDGTTPNSGEQMFEGLVSTTSLGKDGSAIGGAQHPNGIAYFENQHAWDMKPGSPTLPPSPFYTASWVDSPAAFHGDNSTFSFADGHAESHKWVNQLVINFANSLVQSKYYNVGGASSPGGLANSDKADLYYVASHYATDINP